MHSAGPGQVDRADGGHPEQLAELHGGGEQAGRVGGPGRRHVGQGLGEQRADRQAQAEAHRGQPGPGQRSGAAGRGPVQGGGQAQVGGRGDGQAGRNEDAAGRGGQPPPVVAGQPEHRREGHVGQTRPQRALTQPGLQVQREGEQQPAVPDLAEGQRDQAGRQGPGAQHGQVQQRAPAAGGHPALDQHEAGGQPGPGHDAAEAPGRPARLGTEHERQHDQQYRAGRRGQAGQVELLRLGGGGPAGPPPVGRHEPGYQHGEHDPERHVDGEHRPPARAEQVRADHHAAEDEPGHRARGEHGGIGGQRPGPRRAGEIQLDDAEHLRDQHRRARALDEPEADQGLAVRRQRAGQRRGGEGEHADQVGAAPAVAVAEPGAGNQQHRVRDRVAAHDQLQ
jgi:hypothetical protein